MDERIGKVESRISRLEGGYEHLATKADLEKMVNRILIVNGTIGLGVVAALVRLFT